MHFGTIASNGTAEDLLAALGRMGTLRPGDEIASFDDAAETDAKGERALLIAGDLHGEAYLFDEAMLLSSDPDLIVDASQRLAGIVIAIGAETTSGTYFLIAADSGRLLRLHWNLLGVLAKPYDIGERLAGEPEDGLDDVDGRRLSAVLTGMGFDDDAWRDKGRKFLVNAAYAEPKLGPVGAAMNEWMTANMPPGPPKLKPTVAQRAGGGFDIVAPGTRMPDGSRVGDKKGGGFLGKLFGRG